LNSLDYHKSIDRKVNQLAAKTLPTEDDLDGTPAPEDESNVFLNEKK